MIFQNNYVTRIEFNDELLFQNEVFNFTCPNLSYIKFPEKSRVINATNGINEKYWNMAETFYRNGVKHLKLETVETQSGYLYASDLYKTFGNCPKLNSLPNFKVKNSSGIRLQNCFYYVNGSPDIKLDAESRINEASDFIGPNSTVANVYLNINGGGNLNSFMQLATITGELVANLRGQCDVYNSFPAANNVTIKIFDSNLNVSTLLPYNEYNNSSKSFNIYGVRGSGTESSLVSTSLFFLSNYDYENGVATYQLNNNPKCLAHFAGSM